MYISTQEKEEGAKEEEKNNNDTGMNFAKVGAEMSGREMRFPQPEHISTGRAQQ